MHKGSTNPRLKQELRSATDLTLWAREVTAQSLGKAMSTLVVQERRLWLSLAERSDVDKVSFLDALISQAGLFGDTVEDCVQQFSAVQKQTEAIQHILPRRDAPLHRRASPSLLVAVGALLCPPELLRPVLNRRPARQASRRSAAPPVFQLAPISSKEAIKRPCHRQPGDVGSCSISGDGEDSATPSPEGGQGQNHLILFPHCQRKSNSLSSEFSGLQADSVQRTASSLSPATHLASGQESARATGTVSGGVACAAQPISLAHAHNSTRLRDSVRQVTSQVQRRSRDCGGSSCLAQGDCYPPGKDAIEPVPPAEMWQGFYSPYFTAHSHSPCPPVSSRRSRGWRPCPVTGSGHQDPQLSVVQSQGPGASAPQPVGASGQLGKEQTLPWTDLAFLRAGVPLEQVSRHVVVTTDASSTGWGATCNGQAASGLWTGPRLLWHINCLELLAVHLAWRQFWPLLLGKHVLVRTDNSAAVSYINRMGGIRSLRMSQLARHLLLWSHTRLKLLRTVHIPGELNRAGDALSRQLTSPENGDSIPRRSG